MFLIIRRELNTMSEELLQEETKIRKAARLSKAFGSFFYQNLQIYGLSLARLRIISYFCNGNSIKIPTKYG